LYFRVIWDLGLRVETEDELETEDEARAKLGAGPGQVGDEVGANFERSVSDSGSIFRSSSAFVTASERRREGTGPVTEEVEDNVASSSTWCVPNCVSASRCFRGSSSSTQYGSGAVTRGLDASGSLSIFSGKSNESPGDSGSGEDPDVDSDVESDVDSDANFGSHLSSPTDSRLGSGRTGGDGG